MTAIKGEGRGAPWANLGIVAVFVAVPLALVHWMAPNARRLDHVALTYEALVYPSVLAAAMLLYVCWRLARNETTCWLAAGVALVGVQGIGQAAVRIARPAVVADHIGWLMSIDLVVQLGLVVMTGVAARRTLPVDPFAVGFAAGVLVTAARVVVLDFPPLGLSVDALRVLAILLLVGQVAVAVMLARLPRSPLWLRGRIGLAIVLLGIGHLLVSIPPGELWVTAVAVVCSVAGTAVLLDTALTLLKVLAQRHGTTVRGLHDRVEHLEADVRVDRERMHELGATIAGIAIASRLLHAQPDLPLARRQALERTIDAEASRLQRLMDRRWVGAPEETDLDSLLEPLVVTHRARGRTVHWERSGLKALVRADDVAEVVNILLENAAQHAGTSTTLAVSRTDRGGIDIVVADQGPGIAPEMADQLFVWGRRGSRSTGQGIGLHIAHRLMVEQGGDLRLDASRPGRGATFVASLPSGDDVWEGADDDERGGS